MIIQETYILGNREFIRTYSNENRYVMREDIEYSEANDPAEFHREYTEGRFITDDEEA